MECKDGISEKQVERLLCRAINALGGLTCKLQFGEGYPDRLCILPQGRFLFVELKKPTGRLSEIQKVVIHKLEKLGCTVKVIKNVSDIKKLSEELCETHT